MNIVLAGAFGKLGSEILKALVRDGHTVTAADMAVRDIPGMEGKCTARKVDVTNPATLFGLCEGADLVITTVGLTSTSATITNYQVDYQGNLNLLEEAKRAGVKKFVYVSVIKAETDEKVPMLHAKYLFEQQLKSSGMPWVIFRPTGYFYDIAKVFMPMIEKGQVTLLGKKPVHANVIDTTDLADFIVMHMGDDGQTYDIGGTEVYSYEEMANMFFEAAGKTPVIKRAPEWLFSVLAFINKLKKNGKEPIIRFSRWTLTNDLVGENKFGKLSFKEYVKSCYSGGGKS